MTPRWGLVHGQVGVHLPVVPQVPILLAVGGDAGYSNTIAEPPVPRTAQPEPAHLHGMADLVRLAPGAEGEAKAIVAPLAKAAVAADCALMMRNSSRSSGRTASM